ncbi:MAG: hypothetical protein LQ342_002073 [Letrouitia transgressa]|nr:MAG: hypothetical protein LQ342_002073 [Letrouitia transgressa]
MDSESDVDILVYPEREDNPGGNGKIRAQSDRRMPLSIISIGMLHKARVSSYSQCKMEVQGTDSKNYKTVGKVELLWCKESQYKSYYETFYVIEEKTPMVIMGAPSFTPEKRPASQPISPIGVNQDQKKAQEQKAKDAEERREKERKEQEEKEKRKRDPK